MELEELHAEAKQFLKTRPEFTNPHIRCAWAWWAVDLIEHSLRALDTSHPPTLREFHQKHAAKILGHLKDVKRLTEKGALRTSR